MQVNEDLVRKVIEEVIAEFAAQSAPAPEPAPAVPAGGALPAGAKLRFTEVGPAKRGTDPKEVVVALPPAFGTEFHATIINVPHTEVLRQVFAGIEEEGCNYRVVKVYHTADVAFIAHAGARLSGSGIGIGILARHGRHPPAGVGPPGQPGALPSEPAPGRGGLPPDRAERGEVRQGREPHAGADAQRPHGPPALPGHRGPAPQQGGQLPRPHQGPRGVQGRDRVEKVTDDG